jgi:ariadne-1
MRETTDCWKEMLRIELLEKKTTIMCPCTDGKTKCTMVVDDFTILKLLAGDTEQEKRFQQALVDSFVNDNPMIQWCPAPGCENAVQLIDVSLDRNEAVVCLCGFAFWYASVAAAPMHRCLPRERERVCVCVCVCAVSDAKMNNICRARVK